MPKRRRKAASSGDSENGAASPEMAEGGQVTDKVREAVFQNEGAINAVAQACRNLKRVQSPTPDHIMKFIDRVFTCAGVDRT